MVQSFRVLAALERINVTTSTHNHLHFSFRGTGTLFWPLWVLHSHGAAIHTGKALILIKLKRNFIFDTYPLILPISLVLSLVFIYFKFIFSQNWDNTFNKYNYLSTNSIPEELVSVVRFLYCLKISGYSWSIVFFYIHIKVITIEIIHILIISTFLSSNYQHILYKMYRFYFPFDPLYLWCHT